MQKIKKGHNNNGDNNFCSNNIINNKIKRIKHLFLTYSLKETKEEVYFYGKNTVSRRKN